MESDYLLLIIGPVIMAIVYGALLYAVWGK